MAPTFTPDRQTFRALVADVAARAKTRLPEAVNGRVESAVKLVLGQDVMPQADGSILVGSSSDPLKSYLLVGDTCECQDWQHGKAPGGWCQHRIAAGIHKRVGELLAAQMPTPAPVDPGLEVWPDNDIEGSPVGAPESPQVPVTPPATSPALPEAPASCNVRLMVSGYEVQWTLRDADEGRLAERLAQLLARYPKPQPQASGQLSPQQHNAAAMHRPVSGMCLIHQCPMHLNTGKDGRQWYSHRLPEGGFCKGK